MSITDELTNLVNPFMVAGLQAEHIVSPTPTCNLLMGVMKTKMGPAGSGVKITDLIEQGDGRFYRGLDQVSNRTVNEGTVSHFEEWNNLQEDVVLAGTRLREVLGVDASDVVKADSSLSSFSDAQQDTIIDEVGMRGGQAANRGIQDVDRALWGDYLPDDNPNRMPVTLDQIFDETGELHGIGPEDLGSWDEALHVWYENPINTDQNRNRHIPQIFHNNGTTRAISRDVLNYANIRMTASVPGYWIAPVNPVLWDDMTTENVPENDRVPIFTGLRWEYQVRTIRYYNTFYYLEQRAPTDRIRHIHVGMMNGMDPSFFPMFWLKSDRDFSLEDLLLADDPTPTFNGMPLGDGRTTMPWFTQEWVRSERYANAIYCELELMYMWICLYRWKMYEVRDLRPLTATEREVRNGLRQPRPFSG